MMKKLLLTLSLVLLLFIVQSCRLSSAVFNGRSDTPDNREGERLWTKARTHFKSGHCDSVIVYAKRAAKIFATNEYYSGMLECYNLISECYLMNCEYEKVIELNGGIEPTGNKKNSTDFIDAHIVSQIQLANAYNYMLKYDAAEACLQEAIEIHRKCENCRKHLSGELLHHMGLLYYSKEKYGLSIDYYNKAISFFQHDTTRERELAESYQYLGRVYFKMSKLDSAENCFNQSLEIEKNIPKKVPFSLFNDFAKLCIEKADYQTAINYCQKVIASDTGLVKTDTFERGRTYYYMTSIYSKMNQFEQSLKFLESSKSILKEFPFKGYFILAGLDRILAEIEYFKGNYQTAVNLIQKVKKRMEQNSLTRHSEYAKLYMSLATIELYRGNFSSSEHNVKSALDILSAKYPADHILLAEIWKLFANLYTIYTDYEQALIFYNRAREIYIELIGPAHYQMGILLANIGNIYYLKNDLVKSQDFLQKGLEIFKQNFGNTHLLVAQIYSRIGAVLGERKEYNQAIDYITRSISIQDSLSGSETITYIYSLVTLGDVYLMKEDFQNSKTVFQRCIDIMKKMMLNRHSIYPYLYARLGDSQRGGKSLTKALDAYQMSITTGSPKFDKTGWIHNPDLDDILYKYTVLPGFLGKANVLMDMYENEQKLNYLTLALETLEKSIDLFEKLRQSYYLEESKFDISIDFSVYLAAAIKASLKLFSVTNDIKYKNLAFQFSEKDKYGILQETIKQLNAANSDVLPDSLLRHEEMLRLEAIYGKNKLIDEYDKGVNADSTLLRHYRDKSFAAKRKYQLFRDQIQKEYPKYFAARYKSGSIPPFQIQNVLDDSTALVEYFLYDSLLFTFVISKSGYYIKETDAPPESLVQELNLAIFNTNKSVYLEKSFKLYTYLIEPIKRYVDNKKVVIIPSGYLHYVPFEALLTEKIINSDTPYTNLPYLIKKCNLQYYFSAHLLYQELNRNKISGFNTKLVAFAPVNFEQRAPAQLRGSNDMTLHLNSLPETEIELLEISKLFKQKNVDANLYLYSDATKEKFLSNSSNSACIHLATHASIDNTNIEKSWIAFSDTDSESFLRLGELYGLNLESDLVVLSSCNSGQGEYKHGEGLVGFTRGFIYSGAQNVLVTLWEVDDQSTSKFMQSFYAAALSGKDYARALWEAKQEMIQHVDYADPYFWAPFVLMGTNGQLSLNQN